MVLGIVQEVRGGEFLSRGYLKRCVNATFDEREAKMDREEKDGEKRKDGSAHTLASSFSCREVALRLATRAGEGGETAKTAFFSRKR